MPNTPELPDERTVETEDGEVTVRETIDAVKVSAGRKKQLDQYEPINEQVTLEASKPEGLKGEAFDSWVEALSEHAMAEAERGVMNRYEQYVRQESFGE